MDCASGAAGWPHITEAAAAPVTLVPGPWAIDQPGRAPSTTSRRRTMTAAVFGLAARLAAILPWALLVGVCLAVLMLGRGTTLLLVGDIDAPTRQRARRPMVVGLVTLVVLVL